MIRVAIYRGGTSKGIYLLENDLPADPVLRDQVILAIFGSPDPRQIDGLGGADSLTSKVAIVSRSTRPEADVDYTFGQVSVVAPVVDYSGNCGNISSGVGPFAIDEGLVKAVEPVTQVRIFNTNTQKLIVAHVPVVGRKAAVSGDCVIEGVPGSGARILVDFPDCGGAVTGRVLPTGCAREAISLSDGRGLYISVVDVSNPCVFVRAQNLGVNGTLSPQQIDANLGLSQTLEEIRSRAAEMIGLVTDWRDATQRSPAVPKMIMISQAVDYQTIEGRTISANEVDLVARAMSMQRAHKAYPVTGALCTGAAAWIYGSLVYETTRQPGSSKVRIGHPAGVISVEVCVEQTETGLRVRRAAVERTARRILSGYVYVPFHKLWPYRGPFADRSDLLPPE